MDVSNLPYPPPKDLGLFLEWFRDRTETAWAKTEPPTLQEVEEAGAGRTAFQKDTRWHPLSEIEIAELETWEGSPFPSPYRLLLSKLGTTDRPQLDFGYEGSEMVQGTCYCFPNWRDRREIIEIRASIHDGVLFDVRNGIWLVEWGQEPATTDDREAHVRDLLAQAPRLLPIYLNRFIPSVSSNSLPVLSIMQTDAIYWATSIREALLKDFERSHLSCDDTSNHLSFDGPPSAYGFWGNLLS